MTPLRQKMINDMKVRGFSERTQEAYVYAVKGLAKHLHRSPEQVHLLRLHKNRAIGIRLFRKGCKSMAYRQYGSIGR